MGSAGYNDEVPQPKVATFGVSRNDDKALSHVGGGRPLKTRQPSIDRGNQRDLMHSNQMDHYETAVARPN